VDTVNGLAHLSDAELITTKPGFGNVTHEMEMIRRLKAAIETLTGETIAARQSSERVSARLGAGRSCRRTRAHPPCPRRDQRPALCSHSQAALALAGSDLGHPRRLASTVVRVVNTGTGWVRADQSSAGVQQGSA
jgi:hypothetical protein